MILSPSVSLEVVLTSTNSIETTETTSTTKVNDSINIATVSDIENNNNNHHNNDMGNITSTCTLDLPDMFFNVNDGSGQQNDGFDVDAHGNVLDDIDLNATDNDTTTTSSTINNLFDSVDANVIIREGIEINEICPMVPVTTPAAEEIAVSLPISTGRLPEICMSTQPVRQNDRQKKANTRNGNRSCKDSRDDGTKSPTKESTTSCGTAHPEPTSMPPSIVKKTSTTTTTTTTMMPTMPTMTDNKKEKKVVTFHTVMIRKTIHRKDFTPQEKFASWITGEEFMAMKDSCVRLARELNNHITSGTWLGSTTSRKIKHKTIVADGATSIDTMGDAGRGLERLSRPRVRQHLERRQVLLKELALIRQHRLRCDPDDLAVLFRSYTEQSAIDARVMGQEDQKRAILCYASPSLPPPPPTTTTTTPTITALAAVAQIHEQGRLLSLPTTTTSTVTALAAAAAQKHEQGSRTRTMKKRTPSTTVFSDTRNDAETSSSGRRRGTVTLSVAKTGKRIVG